MNPILLIVITVLATLLLSKLLFTGLSILFWIVGSALLGLSEVFERWGIK